MSSSSKGNAFVAGADQEYTPGKIYSSGLLNMELGKWLLAESRTWDAIRLDLHKCTRFMVVD